MTLYNVVFSGQLLEGFEAEQVKLKAGQRMRLSAANMERLFNGKPAVVKKSVDDSTGKRFVRELGQLGMNARLVQILQMPSAKIETPKPADTAAAQLYKVVFFGKTLADFEMAEVKAKAAKRLGQPLAIMDKVFSGHKVVLKRNTPAVQARRYIDELAAIGMAARVELQNSPVSVSVNAPVAAPIAPPVDFNKTQLNPFAAAFFAEQLAIVPDDSQTPDPSPSAVSAAESHADLSKTAPNPLSDEQVQSMIHNTQFDLGAHHQVYGHEASAKSSLAAPELPNTDGHAIRHRLHQASAAMQAELEAKLTEKNPVVAPPMNLAEEKSPEPTPRNLGETTSTSRGIWQRAFRRLFKKS